VREYIIAHGVYSWVPPDVQQALLRLCAQNLSETGLAMISFNVYPGWQNPSALREALKLHAGDATDAPSRIERARHLLDGLATVFAAPSTPYAAQMKEEIERARKAETSYFFHEYLEENNEPLYFHQFASRIATQGLQFLWEAQPHVASLEQFTPPVRQALVELSRDPVALEQNVDLLKGTRFRQPVLCKAGVAVDRSGRSGRFEGIYAAGPVRREAPTADGKAQFSIRGGRQITAADREVATMLDMFNAAWPSAVSFGELVARIGLVGRADGQTAFRVRNNLAALMLQNAIELMTYPPPIPAQVSNHPLASPLVRLQAARGPRVTTLCHKTLDLPDAHRKLLAHLDGSRTREDIARVVNETPQRLKEELELLRRRALLLR
jgi:methyltransferase-like protein